MRDSAALLERTEAGRAGARGVSAVVVTHNGARHIGACLRSLLGAGGVAEVVVVDNASADGTAELVRREFPRARVVAIGRNLGYGEACNLGVRLAGGEYVAIVNQDVVARPGWAERLVEALAADPGAALATPKILVRGAPDRINACGNAPHYTGITPCRGYNRPAQEYGEREEVGAVSGAAFVARRAVFEALGGFDPSFFMYLEDTDLSLRARLAGYRCLYVPGAVVEHEFSPSFAAEKIYWLERNRPAMLLKLYRWPTLVALAPALLLAELAVWGYCLLRGRSWVGAKLRAYAWVAGHLGAILAARWRTQRWRRVPDRALLACCTAELELEELRHPVGRVGMGAMNPLLRGWHRVVLGVARW